MRERKACDLYDFTMNRTVFWFFLSFRLRAPSSEGATKQEPLRWILTCSISTVPTTTINDGSTNCMGSFRKHRQLSETFHYQLSTVNLNSLSIVHCPLSIKKGMLYRIGKASLNRIYVFPCNLTCWLFLPFSLP